MVTLSTRLAVALPTRHGQRHPPLRGAIGARAAAGAISLVLAAASILLVPTGPSALGGRVAAQEAPLVAAGDTAAAVIDLPEAIRLSLQVSPAAVASRSAVSNAEATLMQAKGAWLPSLTMNTSYLNSSNQRFDQSTGRLVSENYTATASGSYDLFSGGRRFTDLRSASAGVGAAEANRTAQRFQTTLQTTQIYFEAAAAREVVTAAEQRLERARQQLEFARTRLEVGTATRSDELRAELEVGNAELALVDARSAMRDARLRLGRQVGLPRAVQPADGALPDSAPALPPTESLVTRAGRTSPSVVAAEATLKSRRADRLGSFTSYLPTIRLSGGYDWFGFDFPPNQQSWSMRVFASLPLFNGFQREATLQRTAAAETAAQAAARDAVLASRVQVESAVEQIGAAQQRVEISRRAVQLAEEDLRVQEERYRIGNATILELQASQVSLTDAQVQAVRARQGLGTAVAQLEAILGGDISGDEA